MNVGTSPVTAASAIPQGADAPLMIIVAENIPAGHFLFSVGRYILAFLGKNVLDGNFLSSAGTSWPFWPKMYRLGYFYLAVLAIFGPPDC